jgi:hypothetical protein
MTRVPLANLFRVTRETVEEIALNDAAQAAPDAKAFQEARFNADTSFTLNRISAEELLNLRTNVASSRARFENVPAAEAEAAIPVLVIERSGSAEWVREGFLGVEQVLLTPRGLVVRVSSPELPFDRKRISLQVACAELVLGQAPLRQAGPNSVLIELPAAIATALRLSAAPEGSRAVEPVDEEGLPLLRSRFSYRLLVADLT